MLFRRIKRPSPSRPLPNLLNANTRIVALYAGRDGTPALVPAYVRAADPLPPPEGAFNSGIQIHFGYADGFSQPRIMGTPWDDPGHPDDDSPLVPAWHFAIAKEAPTYSAHDLLVNGSFGAFRLLYQDVGAFNEFLALSESPDMLAAKICGRWLDGTPLEVSPGDPDPSLSELDLINFNYLDPTPNQKGPRTPDDLGSQCPYAAHTRRTNPRDDVLVNGDTSFPSPGQPGYTHSEYHRIRRFATPYGPAFTPETKDQPRGLVGLFMGADLGAQFEFLMMTWISAGSFRSVDASPNDSGIDPLFGPHSYDPGKFRLSSAGVLRLCELRADEPVHRHQGEPLRLPSQHHRASISGDGEIAFVEPRG